MTYTFLDKYPEIMNARQIASALRVNESSVGNLLHRHLQRSGKSWKVPKYWLETYLKTLNGGT